ncbi:hypothetical protein [Kineococcus sp. SYSU DK006]|uniref:hypothetical protein n=1 Tax=Kineococcus sp. SYSU DK006 TaxID=3383127 RepID=UPI003D7C37A1
MAPTAPHAPGAPAPQPPAGQPPAGQPPAGQPPAGQPPAGWAAWALTAAALLPVALAVLATAQVLGGALDERWFASYSTDGDGETTMTVDPGVTFWQRWSVLALTVPLTEALLASAAACTALAVLRLVGRPAWVVPGPVARWAAAGVAWATAAASATALAVVLTAAGRPEGESYFSSSGSLLVDAGPQGAQLLAVLAVAAVAGAALVRPGAPAQAPEQASGPGPATPVDPPAPEAPEAEAPDAEAPDAEAPEAEAPEEGAPEEGAPEEGAAAELPRPTAEEYALYRRPRP